MVKNTRNTGFTIVELLIVIVVIAILAAISIVSYNGITNQARQSALKSDLQNGATELQIIKIRSGSYPTNANDLKKTEGTNLTYNVSGEAFCLSATNTHLAGVSYYITQEGKILEGDCTPPVTTMQAFTPSLCAALPTYTGTNEAAVRTLTDNRGETTRSYRIAKLADDQCWMLDNLKLGSTTATTTLTPSNTDINDSYTLPRITNTWPSNPNAAAGYGPVPGDTGTGQTNYGYLYNWIAATAKEVYDEYEWYDETSFYSICPANWRLPKDDGSGRDFPFLNARMNNPSASSPSSSSGSEFSQNWQYTGPFKGVRAGYWLDTFGDQLAMGYVWTGSLASDPEYATSAYITSSVTVQGMSGFLTGASIRCVLR